MNARNIKLLFLTGTPIINHPHELVPCFNMLRGWVYSDDGRHRYSLFPKSKDVFCQYFVDEVRQTIKNKARFQNRILGLASYYGDYYVDFDKIAPKKKAGVPKQAPEQKAFPSIIGPIIEKVPMSQLQYTIYDTARDSEREESTWAKPSHGEGFSSRQGATSTSYRFKSRQASNFIMPEHAMGPKRGNKKREDLVGNLTIEDISMDGLKNLSPKMAKLSMNLRKHMNSPGIIYSEFKSRDLAIISRHLEFVYGFHRYGDHSDDLGFDASRFGTISEHLLPGVRRYYAVITGDITLEQRAEILAAYNDLGNSDGSKIALLLISEPAEGIDTKGIRHVHIFEPYWNYARINQVIYRAVRFMSHVHLPKVNKM